MSNVYGLVPTKSNCVNYKWSHYIKIPNHYGRTVFVERFLNSDYELLGGNSQLGKSNDFVNKKRLYVYENSLVKLLTFCKIYSLYSDYRYLLCPVSSYLQWL